MPDGKGCTPPYRRWLADCSFSSTPQHVALQEYRNAIDETEQRIERLTENSASSPRAGGGRRSSRRSKRSAA